MSQWSNPDTVEQARKLSKLMSQPIPAWKAAHVLYDVCGDDDFYHHIAEREEDNPNSDIRDLLAEHVAMCLRVLNSYFVPWDEEAVQICKHIPAVKQASS